MYHAKFFSFTQAVRESLQLYFHNLRRFILPITLGAAAGAVLYYLFRGSLDISTKLNLFSKFMKPTTVKNVTKAGKIVTVTKYQPALNEVHFTGQEILALLLRLILDIGKLLVGFVYSGLLINYCLKIYNNQATSWKDFFKVDFSLTNFLLFSFWYLFIVIGGFLLFIVPGVIWLLRYTFADFFIIDQKQPIEKSMSASSYLAWGVKTKLFLVLILYVILMAITAAIFKFMPVLDIVFWILAGPILTFILISIYKQLLGQTSEEFKNKFLAH